VIFQAIRLDDDPELGPEEVDFIAVDPGFRLRRREPGRTRVGAHQLLQPRVAEAEGERVEELAQRLHAGLAAVVVERSVQHVCPHPAELVGLVDRALELHRPQSRRLVDQRADRRGEGDAFMGGDIGQDCHRASVDSDPALPAAATRRHGHVDRVAALLSKAPQGRGAPVAQDRIRPAGEHRRHPAPPPAELRSSHRVHAAPHRVQAPGGDPPLDSPSAEAQLQQLPARDRAVLPPHQRPDRRIAPAPIRRLVI